ncbi:MAG: hypothetical protein WC284_14730 [Candidimonas sp.]
MSKIDLTAIRQTPHFSPSFSAIYAETINAISSSVENRTLKKISIEYMEEKNLTHKKLKNVEDWRFSTIGKIVYLLKNKIDLPERTHTWLNKKMAEILEIAETSVDEEKSVTSSVDLIEMTIIDMIKRNFEDGEIYRYISTEMPRLSRLKSIIEVINQIDTDGLSKKDEKTLKTSSEKAIKEINRHIDNEKAKRPSRIKAVSPEKIISKIKYKKDDENTQTSSINPTKLIGSKALFVLNCKTRKGGIYYASDEDGLSVKGTTIVNYDTEKSQCKTFRKPKDIVDAIKSSPITKAKKYFDEIRSVATPLNGRISEDVILIKIW